MLKAIGEQREGKLGFVVFDIKTPDHCDFEEEGCGIATVVNMARDLVLSKSIDVVYGITNPENAATEAFRYLVENLDDDAGVCITGQTEPVLKAYEEHGSAIPGGKRIIDYSNPYLGKDDAAFSKCEHVEGSEDECPNLVHAVEERDNGNLGAVFMWTVGSSADDGHRVKQVLDARVDGIVYGYAFDLYEDSGRTVKARGYDPEWVDQHSNIGTVAPSRRVHTTRGIRHAVVECGGCIYVYKYPKADLVVRPCRLYIRTLGLALCYCLVLVIYLSPFLMRHCCCRGDLNPSICSTTKCCGVQHHLELRPVSTPGYAQGHALGPAPTAKTCVIVHSRHPSLNKVEHSHGYIH